MLYAGASVWNILPDKRNFKHIIHFNGKEVRHIMSKNKLFLIIVGVVVALVALISSVYFFASNV